MVLAAIVGGAGLMPTLRRVYLPEKKLRWPIKKRWLWQARFSSARQRRKAFVCCRSIASTARSFSVLQGNERGEVDKIILTASGGPFLQTPLDRLEKVTVAQALKHPNWKMGQKDHHRFGDHDEQGTGSDRGALGIRYGARAVSTS